MLDQNITTLLSALLGGFLSIIGGISANFYLQRASTNTERQKEIRCMIEIIYKDTQKILNNCTELDAGGLLGYDMKKSYEELDTNIDEIEMLIDLHFSKIKINFDEYKEAIAKGIQISIKPDKKSPEYTVENFPDLDQQEEATKKFREVLRSTLYKKWYS